MLPFQLLQCHKWSTFHTPLKKYTSKCFLLLHYRTFTPFFVNLHCITIICTTIHETYALMMWIYDHYSKWQCWRVESEPHQFHHPNWFTCKPFSRWWGDLFVECQILIVFWIPKDMLVESLICLSKFISNLSSSSYDFHSCDCSCVECCPIGLLYTPIKHCSARFH